MKHCVRIDDKDYVQIGDKLVAVDHFDEDGTPVIGCWSEEKKNAAGGTDCTIHVPCLTIVAKPHKSV